MNSSELKLIRAAGMAANDWWGYQCGRCSNSFGNTYEAERCCRKAEKMTEYHHLDELELSGYRSPGNDEVDRIIKAQDQYRPIKKDSIMWNTNDEEYRDWCNDQEAAEQRQRYETKAAEERSIRRIRQWLELLHGGEIKSGSVILDSRTLIYLAERLEDIRLEFPSETKARLARENAASIKEAEQLEARAKQLREKVAQIK